MQNKTGYVLIVSIIVIIALIMLKADLETYGEIRPDTLVTAAFEQFQVKPSLKYYLAGSENNPDAILGIDYSLVMDERFWISINLPDPEVMKKFVSAMMNRPPDILKPQGFTLISNTGRNVGMLYSFPGRITFIKFEKLNTVTIFPPRMPKRQLLPGSPVPSNDALNN